MNTIADVFSAMVQYDAGDAKRIHHFIKVFGFAKTIGVLEGLDEKTQEILEIAALTHDIGIKLSEQKYGSASGHYQEIEGPAEARALLEALNIEEETIARCCWLIAHHHTYTNIDNMDYQILIEADFLVNAYEGELSRTAIECTREQLFVTESGKKMLNEIYYFE